MTGGRIGTQIARWALVLTLTGLAVSIGWTGLYRLVPVPVTSLMLMRAPGSGMAKDWVPLSGISPHLVRAVIASEDSGFCNHGGFDWAAIEQAFSRLRDGDSGSLRGGSTISQQTAKNAFLWPDRSWPRKAAEAWFTLLIEGMWSKHRIMEVYLNIVEWDDGVYGAEAAARHHFNKPAADLTRREAALLAVALPNPRGWSAGNPGPYVRQRASVIEARMDVVRRDGLAGCAGS